MVFDNDKDQHFTHVDDLLQTIGEKDMKCDIDYTAFDKPNWREAGFHIESIGKNGQRAFMIVLRENLAPDAIESIEKKL